MKVLLDANILISYLLYPKKGTIATIIHLTVAGRFTLLLPQPLLFEVIKKIHTKDYLRGRIDKKDAAEFLHIMQTIALLVPTITEPIPSVTRDTKDDYLLAYAVVGRADYVVTGDKDLLVLGKVDRMKIISPQDFVVLIKERETVAKKDQ